MDDGEVCGNQQVRFRHPPLQSFAVSQYALRTRTTPGAGNGVFTAVASENLIDGSNGKKEKVSRLLEAQGPDNKILRH